MYAGFGVAMARFNAEKFLFAEAIIKVHSVTSLSFIGHYEVGLL